MNSNSRNRFRRFIVCLLIVFISAGCTSQDENPRLSMFVGVDISGSFVNSGYYDNSISFLAHYIYAHVNGVGEFEKPNVLFVGSIGGTVYDDPKTFYPIQTFENKSVDEIEERLFELFPNDQKSLDPNTDFNVFFEHIARLIENHNLVLRPVSVVMLSDGIPDYIIDGERHLRNFSEINLGPLERLSRNVTIRLLYSDPADARAWQTEVPRRRTKIWTQDAEVMATWNSPTIYLEEQYIEEQERWINWTRENVNYNVRARRVD